MWRSMNTIEFVHRASDSHQHSGDIRASWRNAHIRALDIHIPHELYIIIYTYTSIIHLIWNDKSFSFVQPCSLFDNIVHFGMEVSLPTDEWMYQRLFFFYSMWLRTVLVSSNGVLWSEQPCLTLLETSWKPALVAQMPVCNRLTTMTTRTLALLALIGKGQSVDLHLEATAGADFSELCSFCLDWYALGAHRRKFQFRLTESKWWKWRRNRIYELLRSIFVRHRYPYTWKL